MIDTLLWYGVMGTTALLDGYALLALVRHALGIKRWDDHHILIAPALSMLAVTVFAFAVQGAVCWVATL